MAYCSRCGVELEDDVKRCPLCNAQVPVYDKSGKIIGAKLGSSVFPRDNYDKTRTTNKITSSKRLAWVVLSIFLIAASLIVTSVDLVVNETMTWSIYPLTSLFTAWLFMTFFFTMYRYPLFLGFSLFSTFTLFSWIVLTTAGARESFIKTAFPIISIVFIVITCLAILIFYVSKKGLNILGFVFIAITLICVGIDFVIKISIQQMYSLSWSIFVAASLLPFSLLMFYLHKRFKHEFDFKKFLHF